MLDSAGLELRRTRPAVASFPSEPFRAQKEFIDKLGVSNPVIFDVGAHKGETVARYKQLLPDSTIFCFEPFPDNFEILRKRFSSDSSVHVYQNAVSDINGSKTFFVNNNDATSSLLPRTEDGRRYFSKAAGSKCTVDVETATIDEIMLQNDIDCWNCLLASARVTIYNSVPLERLAVRKHCGNKKNVFEACCMIR